MITALSLEPSRPQPRRLASDLRRLASDLSSWPESSLATEVTEAANEVTESNSEAKWIQMIQLSSEFSDDPVGLSGDTTCAISEFHSRNRSQMMNRIIHFAGTKKHGDIRRLQVARGCSMLFPKQPKPHLRAVSENGCHFWHIPAWKQTQIVRRGTIRQVSALGRLTRCYTAWHCLAISSILWFVIGHLR
jgi:hypothetical protein